METISFDEMSTLDVPSAALRSSLDKIASALQKVGAAGTDASAAVDELRTSLRALFTLWAAAAAWPSLTRSTD